MNQSRQFSLSSGSTAVARLGWSSEARYANADSTIEAVDRPVGSRPNRPGSAVPSLVTPTRGVRAEALA